MCFICLIKAGEPRGCFKTHISRILIRKQLELHTSKSYYIFFILKTYYLHSRSAGYPPSLKTNPVLPGIPGRFTPTQPAPIFSSILDHPGKMKKLIPDQLFEAYILLRRIGIPLFKNMLPKWHLFMILRSSSAHLPLNLCLFA